jgi:hypothetical protein
LDVQVPNLADVVSVSFNILSNNNTAPSLAILNPTDLLGLTLEKDTQGNLLGRIQTLPDGTVLIDGIPAIGHSAVPPGTMYVGDFAGSSEIKDYQAVTVRISETVSGIELENTVYLIIEGQLAPANYTPLVFMSVDISTAITNLTRA